MDVCGVHGLVSKVGGQISLESGGAVQGRRGLASIKHDCTQEIEICGGQRAAVDRDDHLATDWIGNHRAAVRIVNNVDRKLHSRRQCQAYADQAVLTDEAVRIGIAPVSDGWAVRAIHRRK